MLTEMYSLLRDRFEGRAIWILLDYIALREGISGEMSMPWIPLEIQEALDRLWDPEEYRRIPEDHLGALLTFQRIRVGGKEFVPILPHTAREHVQRLAPIRSDCVYELTPFGTGRIALELYRAGARAIVGVEESLLLYRIGVLNVHLHRIPALVYYKDMSREPNVWNPLVRKRKEPIEV